MQIILITDNSTVVKGMLSTAFLLPSSMPQYPQLWIPHVMRAIQSRPYTSTKFSFF